MGSAIKQDVCNEWVARDKKVIAPCQHLSYFPLAVWPAPDIWSNPIASRLSYTQATFA